MVDRGVPASGVWHRALHAGIDGPRCDAVHTRPAALRFMPAFRDVCRAPRGSHRRSARGTACEDDPRTNGDLVDRARGESSAAREAAAHGNLGGALVLSGAQFRERSAGRASAGRAAGKGGANAADKACIHALPASRAAPAMRVDGYPGCVVAGVRWACLVRGGRCA